MYLGFQLQNWSTADADIALRASSEDPTVLTFVMSSPPVVTQLSSEELMSLLSRDT